MKIGVLTFHRVSNYGTALQAFATVEALRELGHDAQLIDYRPDYLEATLRPMTLTQIRNFRTAVSYFANKLIYGNQFQKRYRSFIAFTDSIPASRICRTPEEVAAIAGEYDALLSGSDQLWNQRITGEDLTYFFPFPHPKKLSYASSFGVRSISPERQAQIGPLLQDFSALALREQTAIDIVSPLAQSKPLPRVVDPTLLLDKQRWLREAAPIPLPKDGYILTYYMIETPLLRTLTEKLQMQTGLPVVNLKPSKRQMLLRQGKNVMWAGPRELLSCYAGAKYLLTNSFHGAAFAINFEIPMFVTPLPVSMAGEVNSRLEELLQWYGLTDRWICEDQELDLKLPPLSQIKTQRVRESLDILKRMLT